MRAGIERCNPASELRNLCMSCRQDANRLGENVDEPVRVLLFSASCAGTSSFFPASVNLSPSASPSTDDEITPVTLLTLTSQFVKVDFPMTVFRLSVYGSTDEADPGLRSARSRSDCSFETETWRAFLLNSCVARSRKWENESP